MTLPAEQSVRTSRRRFLTVTSVAGLGSTLFPGALLGLAARADAQNVSTQDRPPDFVAITPEMIEQAAAIAGVKFTAEQRMMMLEELTSQREDIAEIRKVSLPNAVAPSLVQDPVPSGMKLDTVRQPAKLSLLPSAKAIFKKAGLASDDGEAMLGRPPLETLAFCTVRELGALIRERYVTSVALTKMYLGRLKRLDPSLHFVITLTEGRALKQAAAMDAELANGHYRGPLHGIPWGAKDLLAVARYPTTWGAGGFEKQQFDYDAEAVKRLDAAGAVLIAKLSMGALAQGDLWFGGRTRNPWNPKQGSSGSSAGSASSVSAGCVGFAIGTETLGSISSPSTRCGVTGLRPSFGLVPRTGAMALSWSMDKIGAITRSVEDCALVLQAMYGPDESDLSVRNAAFNPDFTADIRELRVGYIKSAFDRPTLQEIKPPSQTLSGKELQAYTLRVSGRKASYERALYDFPYTARTLDVLRGMGVTLRPVELPKLPFGSIVPMLEAEAAAAFDELTRSGRDALLNGQQPFDWPNQFRVARLYPAVDYINASRVRTLAMQAMHQLFADFDVIVTPSGGTQLTATNLCGQPAVIVPNGIRGKDAPPAPSTEDGAQNNVGGPGTPVSITFLAPLYGDAKACALAHAYQQRTGFHLRHPQL